MSMIDLHHNEVLYKLAPAAVAAFFLPLAQNFPLVCSYY